MAPLDAPWHEWATALPGSVDKGPIPSKLILFLPLTVFLLQAAYAVWVFRVPIAKKKVSKFYATLIVLNIITMSVVTGLVSLNGLLPGFIHAEKKHELEGTALALYYVTVGLFSAFHSVNNCCRVVFDMYGCRAAMKFIPVAVLLQGWQLVALPYGLDPFTGLAVLMLIDYSQHSIALVYWLVKVCLSTEEEHVKKDRLWCGIGGVIFHMASVAPQMFYIATTPVKLQTTNGLCAIYLATVIIMFVSHCFWIAMTLRTRPRDSSDDPLAVSKSDHDETTRTDDASIWAVLL